MTELKAFTSAPCSPTELDNSFDTMEFVFDRKANPQRPIRFDRMRLRSLQVLKLPNVSRGLVLKLIAFLCELPIGRGEAGAVVCHGSVIQTIRFRITRLTKR